MNRREFLKIAGITAMGAVIGMPLTFAQVYRPEIIRKIKNGKYPGEIKALNEENILKEGVWAG